MKKFLQIMMVLIFSIVLGGCADIIRSRHEINNLEFIRAIAIDISRSTEGNVMITITSERVHSSGGMSEEKAAETVYSEGRTVSEAIADLNKFLDKKPFLGHLEYIIIGEEAAKAGILQYLDFFSRDHEVRLNLLVFILKGHRAEVLMREASGKDKFIFDRLAGLLEGKGGQSVMDDVDLIEVMYILDMKYLSLYLPCIEIVKVTENNQADGTMDIQMGGFAIFDGDKLVGMLGDEMGRGLNWLRDLIDTGIIVVKSPMGCNISLEIIDTHTKIEPKIQNGELSATVRIGISSNIDEIQSQEDIFNIETIQYLQRQQEQVIRHEVSKVIKYAQTEVGLDFFSMGDIFYHKYPALWEDVYKKEWATEFPNVKFDIVVESKINRTYDISQPNAAEDGDR